MYMQPNDYVTRREYEDQISQLVGHTKVELFNLRT